MAAIRDSNFAYETLTTDAGLTIPMCAYEENDLLFAFCTGDSGAPTWGCSNGIGTWTQLFAQNNSASTVCYWKYAAASGEGDVVFTSTVNETYNGILVAVRDVYLSYSGGSPPTKSNTTSTGTRFTIPTISTAADDSLVLVFNGSTAAAGSIHFVESALQEVAKVDGSAESSALGWFFQKVQGTTTAYNAGASASGSGVKAVIEVRAPAGGSTVIPPYPVSDASIYLSPNPSSAFDGNTAMAATADTNWGTSINGKTANDATVAAAVDIGMDAGSFMSMSGLTNATTANQISGAEMVVAASRYDVGNRNILLHFRHPTPAHNQRLSPLSSGRGVWAGMMSGTTGSTNRKIWQVHGKDAKMPAGYVMPIVLNAANSDYITTAGTLSNSDVRRCGFWIGGIGSLTNQSCFGPMWAMDTTVFAGGVSAEPIGIPEIVQSAALNKNRFSSLLQGEGQMLCLQAIQFGDGGTNPVYLNLDSTAIEFPSQKNYAKKVVNYNGIDNEVGFTYYPGASDTIIHRSSVISSPSKYHWRIHASASASASYDFSGLSIIGAGDVTLQAVTTFTGMSFTDCPAITQNGAVMTSCTFTDSVVNASSPANADNISASDFVSSGTGHGMIITGTAADITLTGLTFTGYSGTSANAAIYVNIASGSMIISIAGGGSIPSIRTAGCSVTVQNAVTVKVTAKDADTLAAIVGARVLMEADTGGDLPAGASVSITRTGTTPSVAHTAHGLSNGAKVGIRGADQIEYNGVFTISNVSTNAYDYTMSSDPGSSATGTPTATAVILSDVTDASGILQTTSFNYTGNQPITGNVRKATSGTKYKTGALTGTIISTGLNTTILLLS